MAKLDDLIQQKQQRDEDWKAKKTAEREELGQLSDDAVMRVTSEPGAYLHYLDKAKPYIHKPQGAPDYALPDLPYAFRSLDDYEFIDMEDTEHELSEKEKDFKPDKTE